VSFAHDLQLAAFPHRVVRTSRESLAEKKIETSFYKIKFMKIRLDFRLFNFFRIPV